MKTHLLLSSALLSLALCTACNDDDNKNDNNNNKAPNALIEKAFQSRYPNATNVEWTTKKGYDVAYFDLKTRTQTYTQKNEAWFTNKGTWCMTESDLDEQQLPAAVLNGWKETTFAKQGYTIDDIDKLSRDSSFIYKFEIELEDKQDYDLFFNEQGELLVAKPDLDASDNDDENLPTPQAILDFLNTKYSNVQIIECDEDTEDGVKLYEVEFIDSDSKYNEIKKEYEGEKDAIFDQDFKWMATSSEIKTTALPQKAQDFLKTHYNGAEIEDIISIEFNDPKVTIRYVVETEGEDFDITIFFDKDGNELKDVVLPGYLN